MKKQKFSILNSLLLIPFLFFCGLLFQSCEKHENAIIEQPNEQFTVKEGMLVFSSVKNFLIVKNQIANFNNAERETWERKIGFKSQITIFNEIVKAETDIDVINQAKYSYEQAKYISPALLHSDIYYKYLESGVIQIINAGTEDEYWDMPFSQKNVMELINEKGLYAVADKIYSVNGGIEKFISDGDFSKIPALLSACSEDKNNGIKFVNQKTKDSSPGPISTGWQYGGTTNKRINMEINLSTTYFDWVTCQYYFYHEIYIQNQNKNWLGSWKYAATETWIDATWYVSMFYSNGVSYNNSFSFHNIIDNYKVSLNPQTGEYFGGGGTLFVATPPYPDPDPLLEEGWEPIWDNFTTFQASRIGGQSGIYATISF